jgi:hypothetical protein
MGCALETERNGVSLVFVSCGQLTAQEKALGQAIADAINEIDGLDAYFADTQTSLEGLTENIFAKLNECVAFVAIMQERGTVTYSGRDEFKRGSLWIEQEIAIASFIQHTLKREIRAFAYIQEDVKREGLRDELMLNARSFRTSSEALELFKKTAVPELRKLAAKVSAASQVPPNRTSPLGELPFGSGSGPIATEPLSINPNFQLTLMIEPFDYGAIKGRAFDDGDEMRLAKLLQKGRVSYLDETVTAKKDLLGIAFASPAMGKRADGLAIPPRYQVFVRRDGAIVFQFAQSDESPYKQLFDLLLQGFAAARAVFADLGLKPRAFFRARATLHAGRESFSPTLASMIDQRADVVLDAPFAEAFTELVCEVLSASSQSFARSTVSNDLEAAWKDYDRQNH